MKQTVPEPSTLLQCLQRLAPGASGRTLRRMLLDGRVRVDGVVRKTASLLLRPGEVVEVGPRRSREQLVDGIRILFEDRDLLVAVKPAGLLSVATPHEAARTALALLRAYVRHGERRPLFVVHRLDRFVSGVLVFAKSARALQGLRSQFRRHSVERRYCAVVHGRMPRDSGTVRARLLEDRGGRVRVAGPEGGGRPAVTHYRVLRRPAGFTTLEVTLETGRKNQIRAHLAGAGHPILGDRAYGSPADPMQRIALHAFLLGFQHPVLGTGVRFYAPPPQEFRRYLPPGWRGSGTEGAGSPP